MSVNKQNTSLPDTLRGFENNRGIFKETESLFLHPDTFSFTDEEIDDQDFWYANLGTNIIPLHKINQFESSDRERELKDSLQDFQYRTSKGKYQHTTKFDWSQAYHALVNELNGTNLRVIYSSGRVLRCTNNNGVIQGLKISTFDLEKLKFHNNSSVGDSDLYLQLQDSDEVNINGYDIEVDWQPKKLDRLALNISVSYGDGTIVLGVRYLNENITTITSSDITIQDSERGPINFGLFVPGNGVYTLGNFNKQPIRGCIYIKHRIYIGLKKYIYSYTAVTFENFELMDGSNFELMNGDNFELMKTL